jgi:hypothetical protein
MATPTQLSHGGDTQPLAGVVLRSRYVLEAEIGRGGHCVVYRAKDLHRATAEDSENGRIALKLLHPQYCRDERAVSRLAREFRQMQALAHPGIARVFDFDRDDEIWFISMELIDGQPLSEWLSQSIPLHEALNAIRGCCEALDYAHASGIVHGDLKPSNVLRTRDGAVKLIDFGSVVSRHVGEETEHSPAESSTPAYASPQVLAGLRAEVQDDVFSAAALAYGLLSDGQRPFGDKTSLQAHRARLCPAVIEGMPVEIFVVLSRSLAGDRQVRPTSAGEFYRSLLGSRADSPRRTRPVSAVVRSKQRVMHGLRVAGLAAAGLCAAVLLLPAAQKLITGTSNGGSARAVASAVGSAVVPAATASDVSAGQTAVPDRATDVIPAGAAPAALPPVVTFESSALIAGSAQSMVAIPIKRLASTRGATAVQWQVESGSAMPNVDYEPVKSQTIRFNEGESVRSLFIPLLRTAADTDTRPPRSFTVLLRSMGGGARVGAVSRIKVTIVPQPIFSDVSDRVALK